MYDYNLLFASRFVHYSTTISDFGQGAEIKIAKNLSKTVAV